MVHQSDILGEITTFWKTFSSSSLVASMAASESRHILWKISYMRGDRSDNTRRHNAILSTSSSVIG